MESLLSMRGERYIFTGEKVESHNENFPDNSNRDIMVFEDIYSYIKNKGINSKWSYINKKKGSILSPYIFSFAVKGIFFMNKKSNQKHNIETHACWNEIIKPENISKGIEKTKVKKGWESADDDEFYKLHYFCIT